MYIHLYKISCPALSIRPRRVPHSVRIFSSSENTECTVTNCSIETVDQQICSLVRKHKINKKRRNVERMSSSHSLNPMNWKYLSWHSLWFYPWTRKTRQAKQGARFYTRIIPQTSYTRSSTIWTISFTILINSINYTGYQFNLYNYSQVYFMVKGYIPEIYMRNVLIAMGWSSFSGPVHGSF